MNLFYKSILIRSVTLCCLLHFLLTSCHGQALQKDTSIIIGAEQMDRYLPLLQGKRVALIVNQTSIVGDAHLVDTLLAQGVKIQKVFAPEHGFRGDADAGELIGNAIDKKTSLPLVSLYGKNKKPTAEQLTDIDIIIFDIQDVGTRFYTYISTMHYAMEACAENNKQFLVLDRPNPNGEYIDGPILEPAHQSFVGMHPIPVVHGLTVGELAQMINGEKWLTNGIACDLKVIGMKNYTHDTPYVLPIRPSPNLPNQQSIKLYPSLCFFEGTIISLGRGTPFPFQVIGYPDPRFGSFTFTPVSTEGAKSPPLQNKLCYGKDLREAPAPSKIDLSYLIDFYQKAENKKDFFTNYFDVLAGTTQLRLQITQGATEEAIKQSWQGPLDAYKTMRKEYLLYP